jgi:hypothetical protein
MTGHKLQVDCIAKTGGGPRTITLDNLIIAGWTGRDQKAIRDHIEELAKLGVPRPATTPIFYRVAVTLLTTDTKIQCMGGASSGEVEPVVFSLEDGLWLGVGSDHTDREAETAGITVAKQLCSKPVAPVLWRFEEIVDHLDEVVLRSHATRGGDRSLYQEGKASLMLPPLDLIGRYTKGGKTLPAGTAMFCGTMATKGKISPADKLELELDDPILGRRINHGYAIESLPVAG